MAVTMPVVMSMAVTMPVVMSMAVTMTGDGRCWHQRHRSAEWEHQCPHNSRDESKLPQHLKFLSTPLSSNRHLLVPVPSS
jgi:hypothetical protein